MCKTDNAIKVTVTHVDTLCAQLSCIIEDIPVVIKYNIVANQFRVTVYVDGAPVVFREAFATRSEAIEAAHRFITSE